MKTLRFFFPFLFLLLFPFVLTSLSIAALVDNGDGTITDTDTNLMWLRDANHSMTSSGVATICINYNNSDVQGNEENLKLMHRGDTGWDDITSSLDTLNNIICGQVTGFSPFVIVEPLTAGAPEVLASHARFNWYHGTGCYEINFDASDNGASPRLLDNGDGTITDTSTGLMWLKDVTTSGYIKHSDALSWADTLSFAGYEDWRLPSLSGFYCGGMNPCIGSELGDLYYSSLRYDSGLPNKSGPFVGLSDWSEFWYGDTWNNGPTESVYVFAPYGGFHGFYPDDGMNALVWAVRDMMPDEINYAVKTFEWDFGDGTTGTGQITSHTYSRDRSYPVTLTVDGTYQRTMIVKARGRNLPPSASMNVTVDPSDATGMTVQVQDTSTDNSCEGSSYGTAVVVWADGTSKIQAISTGDTVGSHKYNQKGTYTIGYSFRNSDGNKAMASPVTVSVPDTVSSVCNVEGDITGTTPLINTTVRLKEGLSIVKMASTDATGHYVLPNVQGGRTYTIEPSRNGYTFSETGEDSSDFVLNCSSNASGHDFTATSIW